MNSTALSTSTRDHIFTANKNKRKIVGLGMLKKDAVKEKIMDLKKEKKPTKATRPFENLTNAGQDGRNVLPKMKTIVLAKQTLKKVAKPKDSLACAAVVPYKKPLPLPAGVIDIDADTKDYYLEPVYAQDVVDYLKGLEKKFSLNYEFLRGRQTNPNQRGVLIDWIIQVVDHLRIQQDTLHLTIQILDLYLDKEPLETRELQLLGITALLIAAKYIERFAPDIEELVRLTDGSYTFKQVIQMELRVLHALGFNLCMPEPTTFLDRALHAADAEGQVVSMAKYFMDVTLTDASFSCQNPSLKAAACVATALRIKDRSLGERNDVWTPTMKHYTGYTTEEGLHPAMKRLFKILLDQSTTKFKGARQMYSSQTRHQQIALWWALEPKNIEERRVSLMNTSNNENGPI